MAYALWTGLNLVGILEEIPLDSSHARKGKSKPSIAKRAAAGTLLFKMDLRQKRESLPHVAVDLEASPCSDLA